MDGKFAAAHLATLQNVVIPLTDVIGNATIGSYSEVRWHGTLFKAKILYVGTKSDCEEKALQSSAEEDSVEFKPVPGISTDRTDDHPSSLNSLMIASSEIMNEVAVRNDELLADMLRHGLSEEFRAWREQTTALLEEAVALNREILRRLPAPVQTNSEAINYGIVEQERVERLKELRSDNVSQFALDLEKFAYEDGHPDMLEHVENRFATADRVEFIQKCIYKYYNVPLDARKTAWKTAKNALNARARHKRRLKANGAISDGSKPGIAGIL
ncbi:unnamed protein product [Cylicocyclus nassatus]|uniref:Uncharacterized protein n=1 Tax=Cylicocyclus nassatus TaxID=53992 RepID=A0AA36MDS7_CYLNA|nr:unnamed protein product [Cylicocyclus nassatus]